MAQKARRTSLAANTLRLLSIKLRNFKGVREFTLDPQGGNAGVYGDNATGKTTLVDAFMWLLFDKDSAGRKDFDIKTLGPDGQVIHNLEHEVEGTLEADGRQITLRKVYQEKWTKKRGSATSEFSGHTTELYIDGVPVQLSEYKARVAEIAEETTFRLLTDPRFFNDLHWQKRREILLAVCGDVSDQEVIASDKALAALPDILGNRSLADHRKVIEAKRREINKELTTIPPRIDEVRRTLPLADADPDTIQKSLTTLRETRKAKEGEVLRIDQGGESAEKTRRLREVEGELLSMANRLRAKADQTVQEERLKLSGITDKLDGARRQQRQIQAEYAEGDRKAQAITARLQSLRSEWQAIKDRTFTLSVDEVCPACGQGLPPEKVESARANAEAQFNLKQSADFEANRTEGKRMKGELEALEQEQQKRNETSATLERSIAALETEAGAAQGRISQLRQESPDWTQDADYKRLQAEKVQLERDIEQLREGTADARWQATEAIRDLDNQINTLEGDLARFRQRTQGLGRIDELERQEKTLAAEYERLERELYLTEEFIRAKVRLLEDRINGRFRYARFKLFDTQVNGGLTECCETLYKGVPYSTALNTGARTNVGLDIINTLSEHYRFEAPIWIDNSEAVTRLIPTRAQVIRLVVSEPDKVLRVDVAPATLKEAV